jgi:Plasmid pRiA4b ORF-3-like protein
MGWSGYHLYSFRIGRAAYMEIDDDWPDESVDRASVRLGNLVGRVTGAGSSTTSATVGRTKSSWRTCCPRPGVLGRVCLAGRRRARSPEDVGGPWGYANFLDAITEPSTSDTRRSWSGSAEASTPRPSTRPRSTGSSPPSPTSVELTSALRDTFGPGVPRLETSGHSGSYASRTPLESGPPTPKIIGLCDSYSNEPRLSVVVLSRGSNGLPGTRVRPRGPPP